MKTDCFAFGKGGCSILKETVCRNKECSFYKSQRELDEQNHKCIERLKKLGYVLNDGKMQKKSATQPASKSN